MMLFDEPPVRHYEEDMLQRGVVRYLDLALPPDATFYHCPNGGLRKRQLAQRLVGLGVRPGVPDLPLVWQGRALFIELKTPAGALSPAQRAYHNKLAYCGAEVMVCRSDVEVEQALRERGMQLRARLR